MQELGLWQKLRHPNIVQFLGVVKPSDPLVILTEYLPNVRFVIIFCNFLGFHFDFILISAMLGKLV